MVLPSCRRCGDTDPRHMVGLMTLWFGSFIDLEPAHGYFYLCPACYDSHVAPNLEDVQEDLARLHPSTAALHAHDEPATVEPDDSGGAEGTDGTEAEHGAEDRAGPRAEDGPATGDGPATEAGDAEAGDAESAEPS